MNEKIDLKKEANSLRKAGELKAALAIYKTLWEESNDKFDGAGLLHCFRKLKMFNEALPLADELILKHKNFKWCKIEVIWTYIEGQLEKIEEKESLENILEVANKILNLQPEDIALKKLVFTVLKYAKKENRWDMVIEWLAKIEPTTLSKEPILSNKKDGWSYYTLWYYYKVNALIKLEEFNKAIDLVNLIEQDIPRGQKKFFDRLKALSFFLIKNYEKAEEIYAKLCSHPNADWWLLYEYAKVLNVKGLSSQALFLMYQAAASNSRLEAMVTLFLDISAICIKNNDLDIARNHLYLTLYVREKHEWNVSKDLLDRIHDLNKKIGNEVKPNSLSEALKLCKETWISLTNKNEPVKKLNFSPNKKRFSLLGKVKIGQNNKPFCFIFSNNNESIFCYKSDLPSNIKNDDSVIFDCIPSFDKKKNTESWKAINVRLQNI